MGDYLLLPVVGDLNMKASFIALLKTKHMFLSIRDYDILKM
jgi:hypothetical protein